MPRSPETEFDGFYSHVQEPEPMEITVEDLTRQKLHDPYWLAANAQFFLDVPTWGLFHGDHLAFVQRVRKEARLHAEREAAEEIANGGPK